jgi:hypothetical protein
VETFDREKAAISEGNKVVGVFGASRRVSSTIEQDEEDWYDTTMDPIPGHPNPLLSNNLYADSWLFTDQQRQKCEPGKMAGQRPFRFWISL